MISRESQVQDGIATVVENMQGYDLTVVRSAAVPRPFVGQLIDKSTQLHVMDATPDDYAKRFRDTASVEAWQNGYEGLAFYMLLGHGATELAGAIWHRPAEFPAELSVDPLRAGAPRPNHTFAVRVYEPYRGRGLARPFMQACVADYAGLEQAATDFRGIWLTTRTSADNQPTINLYQRFGYMRYGASADKQRLAMLLSPERVTQIRRRQAGD